MTSERDRGEADQPARRSLGLRSWAIWTLPGRLLGPVLVAETTAFSLVALGLLTGTLPTPGEVLIAVALAVLGIAHTETAVRVERVRRRVVDGNHVDLSSVWTFAAAVALPGPYAALVAVAVHGHLWCRAWRLRVPLYRQVFSSATVVLATLGAATVLRYSAEVDRHAAEYPLWGIVLALLVYTTINSCLIAGAIAVSDPHAGARAIFASWDDNVLEVATLCLGALTALALAINGWLLLLVPLPLLVLHRAVLVQKLQVAADTDAKTGLLNAAAWHVKASSLLAKTDHGHGGRGVLVLDLDHFKSINDTHGHLAGDLVLAEVAAVMRGEVRDCDLVGRFGGEEFVVLLAAMDGSGSHELQVIANRIRERVAALQVEIQTPDGPLSISGLSISVGAALHGPHGGDLDALLQVADTALYAAKRAGRNVVRIGQPVVPQDVRDRGRSTAS